MRFQAYGLELDYEVRGEGRPLVFVHGLAGDRALLASACDPVFAALAGWRRIHLDLPGHGASPAGSVAGADQVLATLVAFVTEVAPGAVLVGHSYGGYLALGLLRELERPAGAMLVCPVVEPDVALRRLPPQRVVASDGELVFTDDVERDMFYGVAVVQTRAALLAYRSLVHPAHLGVDRTFLNTLRGQYQLSGPYAGTLAGFDRPLAIVCGRDDFWVGFEDATRLLRIAPRAELAVLPECGQLLPIEQGARFRQLLGSFLERL